MSKWLRRYAIASRQKHRAHSKKQFLSFEMAKTVGITFKAEKGVLPHEVTSTLCFLAKKNIRCTALGYYDGKTVPDTLIGIPLVVMFSNQDVNWYGRPISGGALSFLQEKFDIVIDFCRDAKTYPYPLQFVVSTVQASMLVGGVFYAHCPYDLIVDAQQVCDTKGYVEQVNHYISSISSPQGGR
ncbi:MAG: hypothetical protein LBS63_05100 [Prevotellaceae bacterium]|jgi:hypothetical protein|nr:hypothetical protein [Prevotellaceae bacterium]